MPRHHPASTEPLTADRPEVQRIIALLEKTPLALKDYHAIGEQVSRLARDTTVAHRGSKWRETLAELVGCSASTLNKALQFREAYEAKDLPALEELELGWSRLAIALGIPNKKERQRLLQKAKEKDWTEQELRRAIQQRLGKRRGGGRPRREVRSQGLLADLSELVSLTQRWIEFHAEVWAEGQKGHLDEAEKLTGDVRESVAALLETASETLQTLQKQSKAARAVVAAWRISCRLQVKKRRQGR
jgi:hypothetical protein